VRRAPQATENFEPVYMRDLSRIYIPYPVLKVSVVRVEPPVDADGVSTSYALVYLAVARDGYAFGPRPEGAAIYKHVKLTVYHCNDNIVVNEVRFSVASRGDTDGNTKED
jgi:hypothetical protein